MYLVTGGAGFIGSNVVAALAHRGASVVVCDWLKSDERWKNLAKHEIADIVAPEMLKDWFKNNATQVDAVIHMGAISATTERDVDLIVQRNIRATLDLVTWCAESGTRIIYASSAATYGDGTAGFDDTLDMDGLAKLRPLNAYGWSKHVVDRRLRRLSMNGERLPPQCVGLKFFNVYGPNEYHKDDMISVVAKNIERVSRNFPIKLFRSYRPQYADGGQLRDFIYVNDCVDVIVWLLDHAGVSGLFNVGTGRARTWLDLANAVFDAAKRQKNIEFIDMPESLVQKYQYFTEAKIARLRSVGYDRPFTSLEDGVNDYVRNYLLNEDRYR